MVDHPAAIAQLDAYYAANWAVADWYIDGVVGNDSNTGTSAAAPLKTGAIGTYAKWDHSVTISRACERHDAATARVSPGVAVDTASTSYPLKANLVPAAGDPFVIERL